MTQIQYIERDGHREFAVVPIELWDRIKHLAEDLDDETLFDGHHSKFAMSITLDVLDLRH